MSDKDVLKELKELPSCSVNGDVLEEIYNFLFESFTGEEALEEMANRSVWNLIVNAGDMDEYDREKGIGRFTSTLQAVITKMETGNTSVAVKRALLDVGLGQMLATMRVGNGKDGKTQVTRLVTVGGF